MQTEKRGKLSLADLRVESFVTTPLVNGYDAVEGLEDSCGLTCTSRSCDGAGPTCPGCEGTTTPACCSVCTSCTAVASEVLSF